MDDERHESSWNDLRELVQAQAAQLERQQHEIDVLKRQAVPASTAENTCKGAQKISRAGLLKAVGMGAVATVGAATLLEKSASPAQADSGTFDASGFQYNAVIATGTDGAGGLDASSDSGYGVLATSVSGDGVQGTSRSGRGVLGSSSTFFGVHGQSTTQYGVFGISKSGTGVVGQTSGESGVYGINADNNGSGVVGRVYTDSSLTELGLGNGVLGESTQVGVRGNAHIGVKGTGAYGVWGEGDTTGIQGDSETGYGAELHGGKAPLRLVPSTKSGSPIKGKHQRGELVVDAKSNLFLCVATGTPGRWKRVLLG